MDRQTDRYREIDIDGWIDGWMDRLLSDCWHVVAIDGDCFIHVCMPA